MSESVEISHILDASPIENIVVVSTGDFAEDPSNIYVEWKELFEVITTCLHVLEG